MLFTEENVFKQCSHGRRRGSEQSQCDPVHVFYQGSAGRGAPERRRHRREKAEAGKGAVSL